MDYKRLPYGVADYTWIKSQNRYCADKTMFIPKMEKAGDFLYLLQILLFINAALRRNIKKTPEVCFKQLQEFDYHVLIVYFNNFL